MRKIQNEDLVDPADQDGTKGMSSTLIRGLDVLSAFRGIQETLSNSELADRLNHRRARPRASEDNAPIDVLPTRRERTMRRDPVALRGSARRQPVEGDELTAQLHEP